MAGVWTAHGEGYRFWAWNRDGKRVLVGEHVLVWERHFGPVPPGYVVHHVDLNKDNNSIDNLRCMPIAQHVAMHHAISRQHHNTGVMCAVCTRKPARARGLCGTCYARSWRRGGVVRRRYERRLLHAVGV